MISIQDLQHLRRNLRYRPIIKSEIHISTRAEKPVRVERLHYGFEYYQANEDAPKIAASLSLRMEMETGIFPFQIGMRFSSIASRIGSMIQ